MVGTSLAHMRKTDFFLTGKNGLVDSRFALPVKLCFEVEEIMRRILLASLVLLIACADIWAQATAQISGTVRDQSGAVLPGVEVKATQTNTDTVRTAVTNETGSYILSN